MAVRKSSSDIKSVSHIRTRTSQVINSGLPYIAYLKISCLEMEKARRTKERDSAEARIASIDLRLEQIEAEKNQILLNLGERTENSGAAPVHRGKGGRPSQCSGSASSECFKIKY